MFGFQGGESPSIVARKREYMKDAKEKWPFMTPYDFSTIKNPTQLRTMVRDRLSLGEAEADSVVDEWMAGKDFDYNPIAPEAATAPLEPPRGRSRV